MFEKHREKKAERSYEYALGDWQQLRDSTAHLLEVAQTDPDPSAPGVMLKPGEGVVATVTDASLLEDRRGAGHWQGASTGVSIPIGSMGGHQVRYRVGATRGHYVQGTPTSTAVDTGTVFVTTQRVVFEGGRQTRECLFSKLVGFQHVADGSTTFSVSNRAKPTTIHYVTKIAGWFDFRLDLALAHYRGTVADMVEALRQQLAQVDQAKPEAPGHTS